MKERIFSFQTRDLGDFGPNSTPQDRLKELWFEVFVAVINKIVRDDIQFPLVIEITRHTVKFDSHLLVKVFKTDEIKNENR